MKINKTGQTIVNFNAKIDEEFENMMLELKEKFGVSKTDCAKQGILMLYNYCMLHGELPCFEEISLSKKAEGYIKNKNS